jgi:PAT family beta-lactamase induction signal transducer AmpG
MGFSSGLPLLLIGSTLKLYLSEKGISLTTVALFALAGLPYTLKFLWSPAMDRFALTRLGRRRSWLLVSQIGVAAGIFALALVNPTDVLTVAALALVIAFFSASQDIVVDAYRREVLKDEELGFASALYVFGYRMGMLVAGAGALILADQIAWREVYFTMSALMLVGIGTTLLSAEPKLKTGLPKTLKESVLGPLKDFFKREGVFTILAFVLLYKVGESMASDMYGIFFRELGFSKTEIGTVSKVFALWAMIAGGFVGGALIIRLKIYRSLWLFGILQGISLLLFSILALVGANLTLLAVAIIVENFTSGMATSAYVAFMASQTNRRFSATQYALLSSLIGVTRMVFGASTGYIAQHTGWPSFFIICTLFAIPGLLLLFRLKRFLPKEQIS